MAQACLLCCRPVDRAERRYPAFALAGIPAHAGCCGGCATAGGRGNGPVEASTTVVVPLAHQARMLDPEAMVLP
jgi:hypothetical protein